MTASSTLDRSRPAPQQPAEPLQRRRRWVRLLVAAGVVLLLGTAGWLVGFSSVFATRQVTVVGANTVSTQEVLSAASVPLGKPLIRQDLTAIAIDVDALKPVRAAQVTRRWPHTITVSVQERTPALAIQQPNGFLLVDEEGVGYLAVRSVPKGVVVASANLTDVPLLTKLGVVATALTPELRSKVGTIQAYTADSIRLVLKDGDAVTWGSADESDLKAQVLKALLEQPGRTYDVSAPLNPSIR